LLTGISKDLELPAWDSHVLVFVRGISVVQAQCSANVFFGMFINVHHMPRDRINADVRWFFLNLCLCCVAIGLSWGRCNNSARAANASTSGACTWICSGSSPLSVGTSLSLVLVSEGTAGVRGRAILIDGDCMTVCCCLRISSAPWSSTRLCSIMVGSWSSSGPCWLMGSRSLAGMLQLRSSLAGRTVIQ
jgi:hypothetical protein